MRCLAVVFTMSLAFAACGGDDGTVETVGGATSTAVEQASTPLVLASEQGVVLLSGGGETTRISSEPAAVAYGVGDDFVAFQSSQDLPVYPPRGEEPVWVWSADDPRKLPTDPEATNVMLLDAGVVGGEPVALVAERFGMSPEDTYEDLAWINLDDDSRTQTVRRPAWEAGHDGARILANGDVAGLVSSNAHLLLTRWSSETGEALWSVEVGHDTNLDLALLDGVLSVVEMSFDRDGGFTPVLRVTPYDLANGEADAGEVIELDDPDGAIGTGLFCREWLGPRELACGRGGGVPVSVSLDDASFALLPGDRGAVPTVPRSR